MEKVALICKRLVTAQSRQKSYADRRRRPLSFEVGDHVFLKISPRRGLMRFGKSGKLSPRFIGPFEILERIWEIAYRLALPPQLSGVHDVFHISMLRKYEPDPSHVLDWTDLEVDEDVSYEERPVRVLERRDRVLRDKMIPLVKVLWKHHRVEEATWEREVEHSHEKCVVVNGTPYFVVSHTLLSLIDPEAGQPFSDTQKRLAACTKMLHSGMTLSSNWLRKSLLPQQATHDLRHLQKLHQQDLKGIHCLLVPVMFVGLMMACERDLYIQTSTVTILVMYGRRRWLDIEKLKLNSLIFNLFLGVQWKRPLCTCYKACPIKRALEVTQQMVHIPSGPSPRLNQVVRLSKAPPSAHDFLFNIANAIAIQKTNNVRASFLKTGYALMPLPAASMAVGQFFSPNNEELELSPQLLLFLTYSPKDIILKEDHPLAFNMSFAISLGLFPVGDLENGSKAFFMFLFFSFAKGSFFLVVGLYKLRCFLPVALAWVATSGSGVKISTTLIS
ncbi:hypothetical protein HYC85_021773 [Camellia sinensis]|uniref:Tf2-1-like SH3-like domain-containing protein n=1 Tax=Camellia sinensis TaxID=4442 RepID=A0A7J7GMD9_CAMSI|nr:hypothetical protein HYC85_021773 [Camellia sinensis]